MRESSWKPRSLTLLGARLDVDRFARPCDKQQVHAPSSLNKDGILYVGLAHHIRSILLQRRTCDPSCYNAGTVHSLARFYPLLRIGTPPRRFGVMPILAIQLIGVIYMYYGTLSTGRHIDEPCFFVNDFRGLPVDKLSRR